MPKAGAGRFALRSTSPNSPRCSARSMAAGAGADHRHPGRGEPGGQPERGLPAQLHDHAGDGAGGLLGVHHLEHVLERERLEVEPVRGVVVGGHGLRVAVDHDGLEPGLAQRHHRVHAGVVELDALPDPVRPGAEDQHLGLLGLRRDLRLGRRVGLVGAVVVGRARGELGGAGVDGLVDRADARAGAAACAPRPRRRTPGAARPAAGPTARPAWPGAAAPRPAPGRPRSPRAARPGRRSGRRTTGRCRTRRPPRRPSAPARSARSTP